MASPDSGELLDIPAEDEDFLLSYTVRGVYQVTHCIGEGAGGTVVRNILTGIPVAIKEIRTYGIAEVGENSKLAN
ncbi:hypothetical protein BD413DRAFT_543985 [Trametes elegans]|nr:hypothetical protein BD413DRAFT_543985 [Trametes elegans]